MLSSHTMAQSQPFTYSTQSVSPCRMPSRDAVDHRTRVRIAGWVRYQMGYLQMAAQRRVVEATGVDPGFLSKLLKNPDEAPLGLDNFIKLVSGLKLNAHEVLFKNPPKPFTHTATLVPDASRRG